MTSRHLLVVAYTFPPAAQSGAQRALRLVRHIGRLGWRVTVLTADPDHYFIRDEALLEKIPQNVRVVRVPDPMPARAVPLAGLSESRKSSRILPGLPPAASRFLRKIKRAIFTPDEQVFWTLKAWRTAFALHAQDRFDVGFVTSPYHSSQFIGLFLSKYSVPYVSDYRDHWTLYPLTSERFALTRAWERRLERRCLSAAQAVVYTSDTTRDEYAAFYPDLKLDRKTHVVWNSYEEEDFDRSVRPLADKFLLVHAGNLYYARDPKPFLMGVRGFLDVRPQARGKAQVEFLGVSEVSFEASIRDAGLADTVVFRGFLPHRQTMRRLCESSGLVLIVGLSAGKDPFIPGKIFEYLGAGRQILALVDPGTPSARLLDGRPGCHILGVDDPAALAAALVNLYDQWAQQSDAVAVPPDPATRADAMAGAFAEIFERART